MLNLPDNFWMQNAMSVERYDDSNRSFEINPMASFAPDVSKPFLKQEPFSL